jgi:integration host factor subunit beta
MATITKKTLIDRVADESGIKRTTVKCVLTTFLSCVGKELARGNRLEFRDFGVFEVRERASRKAQNPRTLQPVVVPAKRTVKFKVGREMRAQLDNGSSIVEVK